MTVTLASGNISATVDPDHGARVTSLQWRGAELLANNSTPLTSGCYPMAPWCGRIRNARFPWRGQTQAVPATEGAHALHGLVHSTRWNVIDAGPTSVVLRSDLDGEAWLSEGSVTHRITLSADTVRCELTVDSNDTDFPAQVGWHPCFLDADTLEVAFAFMYERNDDGITDGVRVEPGPGPWDDCFTGASQDPVVRWRDCRATITSDCDHWVIYNRVRGLTCVEPQSGPPNAFNQPRHSGDVAGFDVVSPGRPLTRWMEIRLSSNT